MDSPIAKIAHVVLRVSDLERSADWYGRALGLERRDPVEGVATMRSPGSGWHVTLRGGRTGTGDLDHVAFCVVDEAALYAWSEHLSSVGIDHVGPKQGGAGLELSLRDPDGLEVELIAERHPT